VESRYRFEYRVQKTKSPKFSVASAAKGRGHRRAARRLDVTRALTKEIVRVDP